MTESRGIIALMGSGELTSSMVEVHKDLLRRLAASPRAVFLDTPAGFQLNSDQLSARACDYFRSRIDQEMAVASFKSRTKIAPYAAEDAFRMLRQADFIMIGPGSPTYAVRQWRETPIPGIFAERIAAGGCLVAASAAALTVGRLTLPVYELYKVGADPFWETGLDILGGLGFPLVVIPHWNNAEGGTHDTRYCYMGEPRFRDLQALLPADVFVLGLDEHTACILDLEQDLAEVRGIGHVTLLAGDREIRFEKGDRFPLDVLRTGRSRLKSSRPEHVSGEEDTPPLQGKAPFWKRVHGLEKDFQTGLSRGDSKKAANALLGLDGFIWEAQQDLESAEFISQAREILREMIVLLGLKLSAAPEIRTENLAPLVEPLLALREEFRRRKQYRDADDVRDALAQGGIQVEDTDSGSRWRFLT